jgi:hypothetical protein
LPFSAILLQILAMRPVHEYNINVGGDTPQVTDLSQVAIPDQRHDVITSWHSSQVEGLSRLPDGIASPLIEFGVVVDTSMPESIEPRTFPK